MSRRGLLTPRVAEARVIASATVRVGRVTQGRGHAGGQEREHLRVEREHQYPVGQHGCLADHTPRAVLLTHLREHPSGRLRQFSGRAREGSPTVIGRASAPGLSQDARPAGMCRNRPARMAGTGLVAYVAKVCQPPASLSRASRAPGGGGASRAGHAPGPSRRRDRHATSDSSMALTRKRP